MKWLNSSKIRIVFIVGWLAQGIVFAQEPNFYDVIEVWGAFDIPGIYEAGIANQEMYPSFWVENVGNDTVTGIVSEMIFKAGTLSAEDTDLWYGGWLKDTFEPDEPPFLIGWDPDQTYNPVICPDHYPPGTYEIRHYVYNNILPGYATCSSTVELTATTGRELLSAGEGDISPYTVEAGMSFHVEMKIYNVGSQSSGPFTVRFYVSLDDTISSSDYLIGQTSASLSAGQSALVGGTWPFPASIPGTGGSSGHWVGCIIDADHDVTERNEGNNTARIAFVRVRVISDMTKQLTILAPNGGEYLVQGQTYEIIWNSTGSISQVLIEYSTNNGSTWTTITSSTPNDGSYMWLVPSSVESSQCLIRIRDASDISVSDVSDAVFNIIPPETEGPDLCDAGIQYDFEPKTIDPGDEITIHGSIKNAGTERAGVFQLTFYASLDTVINPGEDYQIGHTGTFNFELEPDDWRPFHAPRQVDIPGGQYYVGWIIDSTHWVDEIDESNNNVCITGARLTVRAPMVEVPYVVGDSESQARSEIESVGLNVSTSRENSDTVLSGHVIRQSPAGGTQVPQGSIVNIVISSGPTMVEVPDVVGDSESQARSEIESVGLNVSISRENSDTVPEGHVIRQSPAGGTQVPEGSTVDLVISLGPAPRPNLIGTGGSFSDDHVLSGGQITPNLTVENDSDADFEGDIEVRFILSNGNTYPLGSQAEYDVSIGRHEYTTITWQGIVPDDVPDGKYSVCWEIVTPDVDESDENDNSGCMDDVLTVMVSVPCMATLTPGDTPPPAPIIQPSNPTSQDVIYVTIPTRVFNNREEALQVLGQPNARIDPVGWTVELYFEPVPQQTVPDILDPVSGIEVSFGPLSEGKWRFTGRVLDRDINIPFTVKDDAVPVTDTIFVDARATGANDGSTWENAFIRLQDALAVAAPGTEIRVAQGTYLADSVFELGPGQVVKGGFAGLGATDPNLRDVKAGATILSGDLNGDDAVVTSVYQLESEPTRADNSDRILSIQGGDGTVLSGFTVQGAHGESALDVMGGSPTISDCTFIDNAASQPVRNEGASPSYSNCLFQQNLNFGRGYCMYNDNSSLLLSNCTFSGNGGGISCGAMFSSGSTLTLEGCLFRGNGGVFEGGGMRNENSSLTLTNCTLRRNGRGSGFTYGMYNENCDLTLIRCKLIGNGGGMGSGGGMLNSECDVTLIDCEFSDNDAECGGAITDSATNTTAINCVFNNNLGIASYNGSFEAMNCLFIGNKPTSPGTVFAFSNARLVNCTFNGNSAGWRSGYVIDGGPDNYLFNCILWDGGDETSPDVTIANSIVQGGWSGTGGNNSEEDPLLDGSGGLSAGSPCIDAGDNSAVSTDTDLDGYVRIIDGDGDGLAVVDIGACEFQGNSPQVIVPDVQGMPQAQAVSEISNVHLSVGTITLQDSDTVPEDHIIDQSPAAGSQIAAGSAVDLVISLGPAVGPTMVDVPDVRGQSQTQAEQNIRDAGLVPRVTGQEHSDTVPAGYVIRQSPQPTSQIGQQVEEGSTVSLVVSLGPPVVQQVRVPNVVGMRQLDAELAIQSSGLVLGTVTQAQSNTVPPGHVISQSPAAGSQVNTGSAVDLVISKGELTSPSIILVTQTKDMDLDGIQDDQKLINWLYNEGYNLDVRFDYLMELDHSKVAELNAADLVIVSRSINSEHYIQDDEVALWNSVTSPMIQMSAYLLRNSRWLWVDSNDISNELAPPMVAVDQTHPVLENIEFDQDGLGIILDASVGSGLTSFILADDVGNGTLIAETSTGSPWIIEWQAGIEFYEGSGQVPAAGRMAFMACTQETSDPATPQGALNLTANGRKMFLNAINYMISDVAPTAVAH